MTGVGAYLTAFRPSPVEVVETGSVFDSASISSGTMRVTSNVALTAGSSQQGNARLASVDSN